MTYSYNKKGKQVTAIASDNVINSEMCFVDGATHVVTEVKYGFNAFLVFEVQSSESYSKQEIAGSLQVAIMKIPALDNPGIFKPESLCRMGRSEKMHPAESRVDHLSSPLTYILFDVHSR